MILNGAQQQTLGEGNQPQDPNAGGTAPQDPGQGEGDS